MNSFSPGLTRMEVKRAQRLAPSVQSGDYIYIRSKP